MATAFETTYHGTWKIIECVSLGGVVQITGIEGTEFALDENGDVSWQVPDNAEQLPFFNCETYEVCPAAGRKPALLKFIGTYAGHVVEFKVDLSDDLMLLTYEKCCMLQCEKVARGLQKDDSPYSLLSALEQGYFSDLCFKSDTGKEFRAHSTILRLSAPEVDWLAEVPPLTGLPEDVLSTTFYFLYTECLPRGLSEATAHKCSKMLGKLPGFSRLGKLCDTFLENTALTQQIKTLVYDMHGCADHINKLFDGGIEKHDTCDESLDDDDSPESTRPVSLDGTIWTNPAKLCYTVRQAMKEEAIAVAKLVIMCDLFAKRRHELSKEERHDIMKFVKSRIPIFLKQLLRLLRSVKAHMKALSHLQRNEIAGYFVPEIGTIFDIVHRFANETKAALEQAINTSKERLHHDNGEKVKKSSGAGDILGKTLKHALHVKELKKLKRLYERITTNFFHLQQMSEHFNMKSQPDKVRSLSRGLVHLSETKFPMMVIQLKEFLSTMDDRVTWKEWKYLFKMATSKVSWALGKVQTNRSALEPMVNEVCEIIQSEQFIATLVTLGLKAPQNDSPSDLGIPSDSSVSASGGFASPTKYVQLTSVQSLCMPPNASKSATAKRALELFREKSETDMVFEVMNVQETGDIIIDHTNEINDSAGAVGGCIPEEKTKDEEKETEIVEIGAHRVIVSARCDWFRRALLSGMKEAIDRKIVIHDTQPELFLHFLEALYSGRLDTSDLSVEQLADMMTLCDRYEMDVMKQLCEYELKSHLDEENALYLLNLADHLNSKELRDSALNYVAEHQDITYSDLYDEMPDHLKDEVQHAILWQGFAPQNQSGNVSELDDMIESVNLHDECLEASSSSEHLRLVEDSAKLEACLQDLLDITQDTVPISRDELLNIAIAADYDVNRALNYIYSNINSSEEINPP